MPQRNNESGSARVAGFLILLFGCAGIFILIATNPELKSRILSFIPATEDRSAPSIQSLIPSGYRTISISIQETDGNVVWIVPGASVDIYGNFRGSHRLLAAGVPVLSVNGKTSGPQPAKIESLTVATSPSDLEKIMVAKMEGKLGFSLRGD